MGTNFFTQVEHLYVSDGMLERLPHNQTAVPTPKTTQKDKGSLFILSEVQGHVSNLDLIEKRLVTLTRDAYYKSSGGITASLRHATQVANQWLFQYNATTAEIRKAIAGGVVAVVLNGEDLFVAQIGPTALFVTLTDYTTRYPEESTWLDPVRNPNQEYSAALGLNHLAEPNITHLQMESGDILVLADARLSNSLNMQKASQIIQGTNIKNISQKLVKSTQLQNGSAMVIQILSKEKTATGYNLPPEKTTVRQPVARDKKGFSFAMPTTMPSTQATNNHRSSQKRVPQMPKLPKFSIPNIPLARIWKNVSTFLVNSLSFLGKGLQTILGLLLPGQNDANNAGGIKQPSRQSQKWVAIVLPIVVIAIAIGSYFYQNQTANADYETAVNDASVKYEKAVIAPADTSRALLLEAEASLKTAATIHPEKTEIKTLQAQIDAEQDIVNNVEYFYFVPKIKNYDDIGTQLKNVIQHDNHLYVFDAGLGRVIHQKLAEQGDAILPDATDGSNIILQQGAPLASGDTVGKIIDIVWMTAGGEHQYDNLLIVTENALFEYEPQYGLKEIPINGVETWIKPVAVDSFYGNLYILDAGANQIYRYRPTSDGYNEAPDNYFADTTAIDLKGAVDMTIDGSIYVLYNTGDVKKFTQGAPEAFALSGLDTSLQSPSAIFTTADDNMQHIYIADSGNQRILQFNKSGKFLQQFKPKDSNFEQLQALFVNETENKIYALDNNELIAPQLPVE